NCTSSPRRITVKGADITGVTLSLLPPASIEGRVVFTPDPKSDCKSRQLPFLEENVMIARVDEKELSKDPDFERKRSVVPNNKGEFTFRNMAPKRYRFETKLPSEDWYIGSIECPDSTPTNRKQSPTKGMRDASEGLALKSGEHIKDFTVTIKEGAAAINGKI